MAMTPETPHVGDFRLSITRALAYQLGEELDLLRPRPLTEDALARLDRRSGVYILYHLGARVYVGKAKQSLPTRLGRHLKKISGRENIDLKDMSFVCLYVDKDLDAAAPEKLLIDSYRESNGPDNVPWNVNGFGNNDPGVNRDRSLVEKNHFDAQHPARLDWSMDLTPGRRAVADVMKEAKQNLPYNFRYGTFKDGPNAKDEAKSHFMEIPEAQLRAEDIFELIISALPEGWQITALPGYVIQYKNEEDFLSARAVWRKEGDRATVIHLTPELDVAKEIMEREDVDM